MYEPVTGFYSLPDELILEVMRYFDCIRSYEPQSSAFKEKRKERSRQCKNRESQVVLHSLCLSSRRLREIATPILYASFVGSATWHNLKSLQLFYRTISGLKPGLGMQVRFGEYLHYIENRLSDHLGNSLSEDSKQSGATLMVTEYFRLLAGIVVSAPNLQHLSIVSLEMSKVSFWTYILPDSSTPGSPEIAFHGLQKLKTICFQLHALSSHVNPQIDWFRRILSAMVSVPMLTQFWASSVIRNGPTMSLQGTFKKLERFNITECMLDFEEVVACWEACEGLRHITCEWAFLDCSDEALSSTPQDLYNGLLRHKSALKTLYLDMREVRFPDPAMKPVRSIGSFRPFDALESLSLCETSLLGSTMSLIEAPDHTMQHRISKFLPTNLNSFTLLLQGMTNSGDIKELDEVLSSWMIFEDCKSSLPALTEISIRSYNDVSAPNLTKAFEDVGVQFNLVKEVNLDAFL
jgi:hypothetical protein